MRIPRIYTPQNLQPDIKIKLDKSASSHLINVLRCREGAKVILFDGMGSSAEGTLVNHDSKNAEVQIENLIDEQNESPLFIHLGLCISKGERMDYAIQKSVEAGVNRITPLFSEHTVVKLDQKRQQSRHQHWQNVIRSACEQSKRNVLPELDVPESLLNWVANCDADLKLTFDLEATTLLGDIQQQPESIAMLIGPEGGLSQDEISAAKKSGFETLRLGKRVLRTETAAVAAIVALQTRWGDYS